jgi:uncharacterized protein (DUF302 family)
MKNLLLALLLSVASLTALAGEAKAPSMSIADTVLRMPVAEGVSLDDAIESMKLRANALNFKLVAHQPMHKELAALGVQSPRIEIFQFCDAGLALEMIEHDMNFVAYMPCRIAVLEDAKGKGWLLTANLDFFIGAASLTPDLQKKAHKIRDTMKEIMTAGANGDL